MPVPTTGESGRIKATACRCMLAPISARFASSCSKNGIRLAETPTVCLLVTSIYSTKLASSSSASPPTLRTATRGSMKYPLSSAGVLA